MKLKLLAFSALLSLSLVSRAQNLLAIPDTLSGLNFNLNIYDTSKVFYPGFTTKTFGVNAGYLGPTLFINKGDSININVNNQLMDTTTIHWHGLHVSAVNDGGPHIIIPPATVWNPKFKVRNHAAMFWYHPHLHMMTNLHATKGAAGLIIVRDSSERALMLPRRYGIDDFPLVIQSKCFDAAKQIKIENPYDSVMMVNGTIKAYLPAPAQIIRLRMLNASSERVYNLGFQGNLSFYQIGTDGGLLNSPVSLTRLRLAPGERADILLDLSGKTGQTIDLMSFASELPNAIYGALQPGMGAGQILPGYSSNILNGFNFKVMTFNVVAQTTAAVTSIPAALVPNTPWAVGSANALRSLLFSPVNPGPSAIQGPFMINSSSFDMNVVNYSVPFNNIEVWTLTNQSPIAHPFHIHDVQFFITEINGAAPPANIMGRKDVVLVPAMQTVKFITRFETFCDSTAKYMYHCHMLTHEDEGMMGQFVVKCPALPPGLDVESFSAKSNDLVLFPNPAQTKIMLKRISGDLISDLVLFDCSGKEVFVKRDLHSSEAELNIEGFQTGIYTIKIELPGGSVYRKLSIFN